MTDIHYISGGAELLDDIQPLWEKLNQHHEAISPHFSYEFQDYGFSKRKARLLQKYADGPVDKAREYVEAMLGLQVWAHKLYLCAQSDPHDKVHSHEEGHSHE